MSAAVARLLPGRRRLRAGSRGRGRGEAHRGSRRARRRTAGGSTARDGSRPDQRARRDRAAVRRRLRGHRHGPGAAGPLEGRPRGDGVLARDGPSGNALVFLEPGTPGTSAPATCWSRSRQRSSKRVARRSRCSRPRRPASWRAGCATSRRTGDLDRARRLRGARTARRRVRPRGRRRAPAPGPARRHGAGEARAATRRGAAITSTTSRALVPEAIPGSIVGVRSTPSASASAWTPLGCSDRLHRRRCPPAPAPRPAPPAPARAHRGAGPPASGARPPDSSRRSAAHPFRAEKLAEQARRWTAAGARRRARGLLELDAKVKGAAGRGLDGARARLAFTSGSRDRVRRRLGDRRGGAARRAQSAEDQACSWRTTSLSIAKTQRPSPRSSSSISSGSMYSWWQSSHRPPGMPKHSRSALIRQPEGRVEAGA